MNAGYFITGTDTSAGKTWATIALMQYFKNQGLTVLAMKPVASGCCWQDGQLKNEDALLMQQYASIALPYEQINPYAFELPVSPHLATQENPAQWTVVKQGVQNLKTKADVVLVEGAGGWLAPLNIDFDNANLAEYLELPVVMVVAIRLGCINHARLTFQAIQQSGQCCRGWLAVTMDADMLMFEENIETLKEKISAPLLGVLPFAERLDADLLASHIKI